jgi:ABC-2 type transport system ATP-binding protein
MTDGDILINGHSVRRAHCQALAGVGGIVENPELYKYLSGWDNLVHFARMSGRVDKEELKELVSFVGLQNRIKDKVGTYSLGMKQRLGIAVSLVHNPSLLVLDEPANGLDPAGIKDLRDNLKRLAREKQLAVVISSHLLSEMEQLCDRVGLISGGRLLEVVEIHGDGEPGTGASETPATFRLTVDDPDKALEFFSARGLQAEKLENQELSFPATRQLLQELLGGMIENRIGILELRQDRRSLEETYLEKMGGNSIG